MTQRRCPALPMLRAGPPSPSILRRGGGGVPPTPAPPRSTDPTRTTCTPSAPIPCVTASTVDEMHETPEPAPAIPSRVAQNDAVHVACILALLFGPLLFLPRRDQERSHSAGEIDREFRMSWFRPHRAATLAVRVADLVP